MSLQIKVSKAAGGAAVGGGFQGDPGLFGFIGRGIKAIGGAVLGRTPVGAAIGTVAGVLAGRGATSPRGQAPILTRPRVGPGITRFAAQEVVAKPGARGALERFFPGGATGLIVQPTGGVNGAGCPSGFHANKSSYRLLSGELVMKGTKCVRNRRRNPMNPRALDRAIGRIKSAKRVSKKLGQISIRRAPCPK